MSSSSPLLPSPPAHVASSSNSGSSSSDHKDVWRQIAPYLHAGDLHRFAAINKVCWEVARENLNHRRSGLGANALTVLEHLQTKQTPIIYEYETLAKPAPPKKKKARVTASKKQFPPPPLCYSKPWGKHYDPEKEGTSYPVSDVRGYAQSYWEHEYFDTIVDDYGRLKLSMKYPNESPYLAANDRWPEMKRVLAVLNEDCRIFLPNRFQPVYPCQTQVYHVSVVENILVVIIGYKHYRGGTESDWKDFLDGKVNAPALQSWHALVYTIKPQLRHRQQEKYKPIQVLRLSDPIHSPEGLLWLNHGHYGVAVRSPSGNKLAVLLPPFHNRPDELGRAVVAVYTLTDRGKLLQGPRLPLPFFATGTRDFSNVRDSFVKMSFSVKGEALSVRANNGIVNGRGGHWKIYDLTTTSSGSIFDAASSSSPRRILHVEYGNIEKIVDCYYTLDNEFVVHWKSRPDMELFLRLGDRPLENLEIWKGTPPEPRHVRNPNIYLLPPQEKIKPNLPFQDLPWFAHRITFLVGQPPLDLGDRR